MLALVLILVLLVDFRIGMTVGFRQAEFSSHLGDNYFRAFGRHYTNGSGAMGKVLRIDEDEITLQDRDGTEKTIHVASTTPIRKSRETVTSREVHAGDTIIIIGSASSTGDIDARLIRILPQ